MDPLLMFPVDLCERPYGVMQECSQSPSQEEQTPPLYLSGDHGQSGSPLQLAGYNGYVHILGAPYKTLYSWSTVSKTLAIYPQATIVNHKRSLDWEFAYCESTELELLSQTVNMTGRLGQSTSLEQKQLLFDRFIADRFKFYLRHEAWISNVFESTEIPEDTRHQAKILCHSVDGHASVRDALLDLFFKLLHIHYAELFRDQENPDFIESCRIEAQLCYLRTLAQWHTEALLGLLPRSSC